ncbi:MAG: protein BatD [Rhodanobacteraceae bacterium]|nr:protein BatD [Rhodanobacteraceae bacterium]
MKHSPKGTRHRIGQGIALCCALLLCASQALAAARASLGSDRIKLGETTTLTVESDEASSAPDFSVLQQDFDLGGQSSSTQMSIVNGRRSSSIQYSVEIQPKAAGVLTIPAIPVGNSATEPMTLTVVPAEPGSAAKGDLIFLESELGTTSPYVQQAVPFTVRLYYSVPLSSGEVTARAPEHASLQQLGEDQQSQTEINGRRYGVFERRYLLIPEQSGPMELPAAQFRGGAQTNNANSFFSRVQSVSAVGQSYSLNVRPQPPGAPQPWLAARQLGLVRADLPDSPRTGEPVLVEYTLTADGALSSQLPDLELPPIPGAQVFPEPAQRQDGVVAGAPVAVLKRRFAIVPAQAGKLDLPALRVRYWNTASDRADVAEVAGATLDVAVGNAVPINPVPMQSTAQAPATSPVPAMPTAISAGDEALRAELTRWRWISLVLGCGLLGALLWGWRRQAVVSVPAPQRAPERLVDPAVLRRALADGDLHEIADALRASTPTPCLNLGQLRARLGDAAQQAAIDALEQTLWAARPAADDRAAVRERLRAAFKSGPILRQSSEAAMASPLAPLYPARG